MDNRRTSLAKSKLYLLVLFVCSLLSFTGQSAGAREPVVTSDSFSSFTCGFAGSPGVAVLGLPNLFCGRGEVTADVLIFRKTTPPSGGLKPTVITMQPGRGQFLGISFFESQLGSAGEQWRSSAWTAIASSSFLLGEDLNQYSFSFDAEGNIDGPSAGGLFTSSALSLILGNRLQSDVTMTGTINPDGSIGPVGGIPLKVKAAHEQGKNRVVIPAGQLTPELQEIEAELGIDVQEAANIGQAYQLLTGQPLPLPLGYEDVPPQMPTEGNQALQVLVETLHQRYQTEQEAVQKLSLTDTVASIEREAWDDFSRSRQALSNGSLAQAYANSREAVMRLWLVQNLMQAQAGLAEFEEKPWDVSVLTRSWDPITQEADALLKDLETAEVETANDAVTVSRAFGHLILAKGLKDLALQEIETLKSSEEARDPDSETFRRAMFYLAVAPTLGAGQVQTARDALALDDIGQTQSLDEGELAGFANTLNTASVAGIRAFESLTIKPIAESGAEAFELVVEDFKSKDVKYFLALASLESRDDIINAMESKQNAVLAKLGASQIAYTLSGVLISQYYSLQASYDPELEAFGIRSAVDFKNPRALINMLDLAAVTARGDIAMAQAAGNDLTQQILMYEQAKFLREGAPADKVRALELYWNAGLEARLMTIFAGKFELASQPSIWQWLGPVLIGGLLFLGMLFGWRYRSPHSPIHLWNSASSGSISSAPRCCSSSWG
jgi:uncharacterized protein